MQDWTFTKPGDPPATVSLPHTWNGRDGQDGGNDYWRGTCTYQKRFPLPDFDPDTQQVYLEFAGVNASAVVFVNGRRVCRHDGGYATFRAEITPFLQDENTLTVKVDNSVNNRVYPQKADFTFYGGIYRDVSLLIVNRTHFDLDDHGGPGLRVAATVEGTTGVLRVRAKYTVGPADPANSADPADSAPEPEIRIRLTDEDDAVAAEVDTRQARLEVPRVHRWDGTRDPYLYTLTAELLVDGVVTDAVTERVGFRTMQVSAGKGFLLNGRPYPLHGVSRHQDRPGKGNAITRADQEEDLDLICEMGANALRLAHYQQDQYFYDLCDERGLVVWAEIPYISAHMYGGRENTASQLTELILQNEQHPSIACWGISNEITIYGRSRAYKKSRLDNLRMLQALSHKLDPTRFTTMACYAACGPLNRTAHVTDAVGWNLYLGWYTPGMFLNDWWIRVFHFLFPHRALAYSEYGCEGMPNLHSAHPKRGDQTEEYQALYHEFMLQCFGRHPWMWGTFVWNMFDFGADARDEGGQPGQNHKGLITFDRQTKKDAFYLYKACWSEEPFVHICGQRRKNRKERVTTVKVYSNQPRVTLTVNGRTFETKSGERVFCFRVPLSGTIHVTAGAGGVTDTAAFTRTKTRDPSYSLKKQKKKKNWV